VGQIGWQVSPQSFERRWFRELGYYLYGMYTEVSVVLGAEVTNLFSDGWDF
jgi:hypothetical protein